MRVIVAVAALVAASWYAPRAGAQAKVPATRAGTDSDTYFGKTYSDPFRWLEKLGDKKVQTWFKAQAEVTNRTLAAIPGRDTLVAEWAALDKLQPTVYSGFNVEGGRLFYRKRLGGENIGKIFYRDGWNGAEKLLFDPATYKPKAKTVVQRVLPSLDGKHAVLSLSANGAEWSELRVVEVDSGKLLPERIFPAWGAQGWLPDNATFFYDGGTATQVTDPDIELNRQVRAHTLGTPVARDKDYFSNKSQPQLELAAREIPNASIDENNPDLTVAVAGTVQSEQRMFVARTADIQAGKPSWRRLSELDDGLVRGFAIDHGKLYAATHVGASRYKVIRTDLDKPDWKKAEVVVPEASDVLSYFSRSKDYLFLAYSTGVLGRIVRYELATGKTSELALPSKGTVDISCPDAQSNRCLVWMTTWTQPVTLYDYDGDKNTLAKSAFSSDVVYPGFDSLVSEEVEVPGHDGTMVPLSIIHKKGMPMDGSASCILTGYGAYGYSLDPGFSIMNSVAKRGVVMAIAHVRGGGEKGEAWYKAGYKATKPNTWLDFIAAAEYLVKKGYTSPGKLAGTGTSAGGILITRAVTTRPDLFAAAVSNVGCANAMRMEFSPNGPVNVPEFGTVKDQAEAAALHEMDGVQHVTANTKYPAILAVAGWNDPRVAPWQSGKLAAAMQSASTSGKPVLLKVNYDNGHFTEERIVTFRNFADQYAFMLWQTDHPDFQPGK